MENGTSNIERQKGPSPSHHGIKDRISAFSKKCFGAINRNKKWILPALAVTVIVGGAGLAY